MEKFLQKALLFLFVVTISSNVFSQTQKYLRKASGALYKGHYDIARQYYLKALEKEPDNYKANVGAGIVMAEYLASYENSLPYLEKALKLAPSKDSVPEILFALGKVYAYFKQYNNALNCFEKVAPLIGDDDFLRSDLNKRISDCYYAKNHTEVEASKKLFVVNAGNTINTEADEYVPVITPQDKILFTSKRKDGIKERINPDNGKYYEAMYIADLINGRTTNVRLFSNLSGKSINKNEAIVSVFPDGQKIFLYRDKKLYEGSMDRTVKNPNKSSEVLNFDDYQNHACLTKDGNTIYFTSESESGNGGNDIYVSVKGNDGNWGIPKNLGKIINTSKDEEAPFISADGKTLYFSSNGHSECYGEFDIYKTTYENGMWSLPKNMGLPINSTGNDVFYVDKEDGSAAYFSSSRSGGYGDLDIYKVVFPDKYNFDCTSNVLALNADPNKEDAFKYYIAMGVMDGMKDKVLSFNLKINDSLITEKADDLNYNFKKAGNYKLKAKLVAWCDTCLVPYVACAEKEVIVTDTTPVIMASSNNNHSGNTNSNNSSSGNTTVTNNTGNNSGSGNTGNTAVANNTGNNSGSGNAGNTTVSNNAGNNAGSGNAGNTTVANNTGSVKEAPVKDELTSEELAKIGLDLKPLYFSFEDENLREDAKANLDYNIEILKKYPKLRIVVNGHTDSRGGKKLNLYLSDRRANTVRDYLIKAGISRRRITTSAKGENFLVNNCDDNTSCDNAMHQLNRRVEIKVAKK